jgi:hypothetical protein
MILLGGAAPTVLIAVAEIPAGASISLASVLWETTCVLTGASAEWAVDVPRLLIDGPVTPNPST